MAAGHVGAGCGCGWARPLRLALLRPRPLRLRRVLRLLRRELRLLRAGVSGLVAQAGAGGCCIGCGARRHWRQVPSPRCRRSDAGCRAGCCQALLRSRGCCQALGGGATCRGWPALGLLVLPLVAGSADSWRGAGACTAGAGSGMCAATSRAAWLGLEALVISVVSDGRADAAGLAPGSDRPRWPLRCAAPCSRVRRAGRARRD